MGRTGEKRGKRRGRRKMYKKGDVCSVRGCNRQVAVRGWCRTHYFRWYNKGEPGGKFINDVGRVGSPRPFRMTDEQFFVWVLSQTVQTSGGCMEWHHQSKVHFRDEIVHIHRAVYIAGGGDESIRAVRRSCGNLKCVNPSHFEPVVRKEYVKMATEDKGVPRGEKHSRSMLTEDQVLEIRNLYASGEWTLRDLGKKYGVVYITIRSIVKGRSWKHVGGVLSDVDERSKGRGGGLKHRNAKLTEDKVRSIRKKYQDGKSNGDLAKEYDVSSGTITCIVKGKTWKHVA